MGALTDAQVEQMGFKSVGKHVRLSDKASFYNCKAISIGDNVRIDDFSVLSAGEGGINIGRYVHIATHCSLIGAGQITLEDFSGLSSRVSIYSSSDDYSGEFLTNPTVPKSLTNVNTADVWVGRHVIIGSGSVVLPGVVLEEGVAIGALSLVTKICHAFSIYSGVPARRIKNRLNNLLDLEKRLLTASFDNE